MRSIADNNRFMLEGEHYLSEMAVIFDDPIIPSSVSAPARHTPRNTSRHEGSSDDDAQFDRDYRGPEYLPALPEPAESSPPLDPIETWAQREPTTELQDRQYHATIRRMNNTQQSWAEPYGLNSPPTDESLPRSRAHVAQDVRFDQTNVRERDRPPHLPVEPVQLPAPQPYPHRTYESVSRPIAPQRLPESISRAQGFADSVSRRDHERYGATTGMNDSSVSRHMNTGTARPDGLWNSEQYHDSILLGEIVDTIEFKVGDTIVLPPGFKTPRISEPGRYSGDHDHQKFMDWLHDLLNWQRASNMGGVGMDATRINFLGIYLTGAANDWFFMEIDNPRRHQDNSITFSDCICAMHRRFVRTATANNAVAEYDAVAYLPAEGTEGYYYKLDKVANRMIERPSPYQFRLRFHEGLPHWIFKKLTERDIVPEYSPLQAIRDHA